MTIDIKSLQTFLQLDWENIFDNRCFFESDMDSERRFYVTTSRLFESDIAGIFPALTVKIFDDGSLSLCFFSTVYDVKKAATISKFIFTFYELFGADDKQITLSSFNLRDLYSSNVSKKSIRWSAKKASVIIDKNISFTFTYKPPNSAKIINDFYKPNIIITENGILSWRERKLKNTEASLLIDDFTKERIIFLTKVAGMEKEKYVYTYQLNDFEHLISLNRMELYLSFSYNTKSFFLHLLSTNKDFNLAKGDSIIFLFDDDTTITSTCLTSITSSNSGSYRNVASLSYEEIKTFATKKIRKWKLTNNRKALYEVGGFIHNRRNPQYKSESEGQFLLRTAATTIIKAVIIHEGNYFNETSAELLPI